MSEYQYYEFQAIDRPLSAADRDALRALSTRAQITATSFTNTYQWGDFKGDPDALMEHCFDLHLYLANWGTRRLMLRLPQRLIDRRVADSVLGAVDFARMWVSGENLILDIDCVEQLDGVWEDGAGRLAALAPLCADLLGGDLRLFHLLWLMAVERDAVPDEATEPLPGIAPVSAALLEFAQFFGIDADLVAAAAESTPHGLAPTVAPDAAHRIIAALPDRDRTALLARLFDGDPHVAAELRAEVRRRAACEVAAQPVALRTAGALRARAEALAEQREQEAAERLAREQKQRAEAAEQVRRIRLLAVERRGDGVWRDVEDDIERRNAAAYDRAAALLSDLQAIAEERGTLGEFGRRLEALRRRHSGKGRFLQRLAGLGPLAEMPAGEAA
jgi:hypothetical protein